jgi:methyl-accepting chemotaxis protein
MLTSFGLFRSRAADVLGALNKSLAIIEFDPQGKILAANPPFCQVMGYTASEIIGKHHSLFVDKEYSRSAAYKDFWLKLGRGEFDQQEYRRLAKGGRPVWIQASYNPIVNSTGKVVRVIKVASDTTAAHERNAAFEAKIAAISRVQGVIEFTAGGEIKHANENFLNLVGYRLEEVKGKHHRMFVDSAYARSAEYEAFWRKLNNGEFVAAEFRRFGKGGKEIWIQASYNPIFDTDNKVTSIVKFATDISGRVRAVTEVAHGLNELANQNLVHRLDEEFDLAFEPIRSDYNASLSGLNATMKSIVTTAVTIDRGTEDIVASSDSMSRRMEQQAASLEQTAAALDQITATVKHAALGAMEAAIAASGARSGTALSGAVMNQAAAVMGEINESSDKITEIIGVIDEIAFQTNLLALNAGVEAARAGDSGRGFAVVAQEVRALAQRSATAAKEIKTLISSSSDQVKRGVKLVRETANALENVTAQVTKIDTVLSDMAKAAQEQAVGLGEVNHAVNEMDEVTQQNAIMLSKATAAATSLRQASAELSSQMEQFRIENRDPPEAMERVAHQASRPLLRAG